VVLLHLQEGKRFELREGKERNPSFSEVITFEPRDIATSLTKTFAHGGAITVDFPSRNCIFLSQFLKNTACQISPSLTTLSGHSVPS
jgi:hypothetical protein